MRRLLILSTVLCAFALLGTGCFSYSTLHSATPVDEGQTEMTLSTGYWGAASQGVSGDVPTVEIAGRHGLSPDLDVGAKLYPIGASFDVNYAFLNAPDFAMSVNPYLSMTRFNTGDGSAMYGFGLVNLLADVAKSEALTATIGLKPGVMYATAAAAGESASGVEPVVGGTAALKVPLSDTFSVMPNIDVLTPVNEAFADVLFYTGGVAFNF